MADTIRLSNAQRYVLQRVAAVAEAGESNDDAQPHWATILLAASDETAATGIEERTGGASALISTVLEKWKEGQDKLKEAERGSLSALQEAIEAIFDGYEDFDTDCFCCCDEDDDKELGLPEIELLANKVYNLLRMELIVERERLGYAYFGRT
jgi:hypothetical protein